MNWSRIWSVVKELPQILGFAREVKDAAAAIVEAPDAAAQRAGTAAGAAAYAAGKKAGKK